METSLHRQLKQLYAGDPAQVEIRLGRFRVDAMAGDLLVEVQHGSLAAIRRKIEQLTPKHRVLLVKPIIMRKTLVRQKRQDGPVESRRLSPKRGKLLDLFHELVYFTRAFPHPNLVIEAVPVEVEEWRYPGHGRRRRWRRNDFVIADQHLISAGESVRLERAADLVRLLPAALRAEFHTGHLAEDQQVPRWVAQRIAYCLREMGAVESIGKQGNTICYRPVTRRKRRSAS